MEFNGRLLDLVECVGHDGRPNPRRKDCDNFRRANGLEPLPRPARQANAARPRPDQKPRQIPKSPPIPDFGPGTELHEIFRSLGLSAEGCGGCMSAINRMNQLGVAGCREQRKALIADIKSRAVGVSLLKKASAAGAALFSGLAWQIDWADPIAGCFDLAVKRAEEKACGQ